MTKLSIGGDVGGDVSGGDMTKGGPGPKPSSKPSAPSRKEIPWVPIIGAIAAGIVTVGAAIKSCGG